MRVVSIKIPEELNVKLEELARKSGMSKSELIRRAIMLIIDIEQNGLVVSKRVRVIR